MSPLHHSRSFSAAVLLLLCTLTAAAQNKTPDSHSNGARTRERININDGWRFMRYRDDPDSLVYDLRKEVIDRNDNVVADTRADERSTSIESDKTLKKWILPSANDFIKDPAKA